MHMRKFVYFENFIPQDCKSKTNSLLFFSAKKVLPAHAAIGYVE